MKQQYFLLIAFLVLVYDVFAQPFCFPSGNVIIYSNYDGGYLNINVDEVIPDLRIGITTYEKCEVTFSGQYVSNITQVIYAGFNGDHDPCNPSPPTTSINGVPASITSILLYPPVTWVNSNGYYYVICNYSCDSSGYQGGCNTPDQIAHYYLTQFGGSLYYHFTQYGCWQGTQNVSAGGNCCIGASIIDPQFSINASFSVSNDTLCAKDSVLFFNNSFNTYPGGTSYAWTFGDGTPVNNNVNPFHIYAVPGNYTVTLIATNDAGTASDTTQMTITLIDCFTGMNPQRVGSEVQIVPNPSTDKFCIRFSGIASPYAEMSLYDAVGNRVLSQSILEATSEWCIEITREKIPSGIYIAVIGIDGESIITKTVVLE